MCDTHFVQAFDCETTCEYNMRKNISTSVSLLVSNMVSLFGALVEIAAQDQKGKDF